VRNLLSILALAFALGAHAQWHLDFDEDFARASSAWTPLSLSPSLWLDASDASTLTLSGTNVTAWADKSGIGNHAVQVGAITTTPVTSELRNGLATMYFDQDDYLLTGFLSATGTTFICVAKMSGGEIIAGTRDGTDTRSYWGMRLSIYMGAGVGTEANVAASSQWGTTYHVFAGTHDGSNVRIYDAGLEIYSETQTGSGANFTCGYMIGALNSGGTPLIYAKCSIGEILAFRRVLSASEVETLSAYLKKKWGF
jgi:hypothetical protein